MTVRVHQAPLVQPSGVSFNTSPFSALQFNANLQVSQFIGSGPQYNRVDPHYGRYEIALLNSEGKVIDSRSSDVDPQGRVEDVRGFSSSVYPASRGEVASVRIRFFERAPPGAEPTQGLEMTYTVGTLHESHSTQGRSHRVTSPDGHYVPLPSGRIQAFRMAAPDGEAPSPVRPRPRVETAGWQFTSDMRLQGKLPPGYRAIEVAFTGHDQRVLRNSVRREQATGDGNFSFMYGLIGSITTPALDVEFVRIRLFPEDGGEAVQLHVGVETFKQAYVGTGSGRRITGAAPNVRNDFPRVEGWEYVPVADENSFTP